MADLLWQKPGVAVDAQIQTFLAGDDVILDREFFLHDIAASAAHAQGLQHIGILSADELDGLLRELEVLAQDFREGRFDTSFVEEYFRPEAARVEDLEKAAAVLCTLLTHFREGAAPAAGAPSRDGTLAVDPWRLAARREGVGSE